MKPLQNPFEHFPELRSSALLTLQAAYSIIEERFIKLDSAYGITLEEFYILLIARKRQAAQGLIGECLGIGKNKMVLLIDRMEKRKLVDRLRNHNNRREMLIEIAPKGRKIIEEILKVQREMWKEAFAPLPLDFVEKYTIPNAGYIVEHHFKNNPCKKKKSSL